MSQFEELQRQIEAFAEKRGWSHHHTPKNLALALTGEVGELATLFQWLTAEEAAAAGKDPEFRAAVEDELADVLIYLVRFAGVIGVDLVSAAFDKLARNEERFPA